MGAGPGLVSCPAPFPRVFLVALALALRIAIAYSRHPAVTIELACPLLSIYYEKGKVSDSIGYVGSDPY